MGRLPFSLTVLSRTSKHTRFSRRCDSQESTSSTAMLIILLVTIFGLTQAQEYFREPEKVIKDARAVGERLGQYSVVYETDGGIVQTEQGNRKYAGTADEAQLIQGSVQYNAPDGTPISLSWTADEFGAQISGSHIPTPPPIPPEIQRALDWIAKQPSTTEESYDDVTEAPKPKSDVLEKKFTKDPKSRSHLKRT